MNVEAANRKLSRVGDLVERAHRLLEREAIRVTALP
jgi:hypothetical protein